MGTMEADHLVRAADDGHATRPLHASVTEAGSSSPFKQPTKDPAAYRDAKNSPQQIEQATQARSKLNAEDQARHTAVAEQLQNKGQQVLVERALASGRSMADIERLAVAMRGKSESEVLRLFSGDGIAQFYGHSCVPTAYQIALAERDPVYALHLKEHPEEMRQGQANPLIISGGALTRRSDMNDPPQALRDQLDPETRKQLDASFDEQRDAGGITPGQSLGIEPTLMPDREIHKALEKATGTQYEVITNATAPHEKPGAGEYATIPFDRIDAALASNQPVLFSQFGHAQTIVGRRPGPDGRMMYVITDPDGARTTLVDPSQFDAVPMISITLPVSEHSKSNAASASPDVQPGTRTRAGGNDADATDVRPRDADVAISNDDGQLPVPVAAARAIPGTGFHGRAGGDSDPAKIQELANDAAAKHAHRVGGTSEGSGGVVITDANGAPRRIKFVTESPPGTGDQPVAHYNESQLQGTGDIVVYVSDTAASHHVSRAVAHELAEIRHRLLNGPDGDDALAPGSQQNKLSGHDVGRIAEIDVMADEIRSLRKEKPQDEGARQKRDDDIARLKREAGELMDHLGLRSPDALARRRLIDDHPSTAAEPTMKRLAELVGKDELNKHVAYPLGAPRDHGEEVKALTDAMQKASQGRGRASDLKALVESADDTTVTHFTDEERVRISTFRDKVSAGARIEAHEAEGIQELIKANKPADPKLLETAKARANHADLPEGNGADHAARPALGSEAAILDSQLLIAIEKAPNDRSSAETKYVEQLATGEHHATDFILAGEPGGRKPPRPLSMPDVGTVPITVPRDSEAYGKMLDTLVRYNVGRSDGSGDQTIVADAFFARTADGEAATLKTADEGLISGLLRASGRNPERLSSSAGSVHAGLLAVDGNATFEVKIHGKTLKVIVMAAE